MNTPAARHADLPVQPLQPQGSESIWRRRPEMRPVEPVEARVQPGERLIMAHDPCDPRCEKIRALRTELLLRRDSPDHADIVALLSPCAGEGRSLLAAELAIGFAQTGHPTLLVDADLRRPQQHLLFGASNRYGLAQAIAHGDEPQVQSVHGLPRMRLLTAGELPGDPLELLSSRRFAALIDRWRHEYEFVVLDTAPVGRFSDGLAVARLVGRVLALSRAQHTPRQDMEDMMRRLSATRSRILGAVVSHF
ncbi:CpsD/CapB family tyrosine-protein kinase [uncultured Piscinibacter sp.]|uniref:CpsD/CapB family tyrosine-protein kinase n=1 Tax=uncultured Piscinibacter sp. TaxID=1131835 RepID=UPI0026224C69|nr:CpsD/CapB family tyrosine-protein kinase [uncultured Piscinibacter sp.]